jgi:hypothetical protein
MNTRKAAGYNNSLSKERSTNGTRVVWNSFRETVKRRESVIEEMTWAISQFKFVTLGWEIPVLFADPEDRLRPEGLPPQITCNRLTCDAFWPSSSGTCPSFETGYLNQTLRASPAERLIRASSSFSRHRRVHERFQPSSTLYGTSSASLTSLSSLLLSAAAALLMQNVTTRLPCQCALFCSDVGQSGLLASSRSP